jgi:hypothetical protein
MTAEIVIMNKTAVALAADSAVTLQSQSENSVQQKIYNTTNKLFSLSKYHPVGIMVYGNAEILRMPWEVIIKMYRDDLGKRSFGTIREHAGDFITFLEGFFSAKEQQRHFSYRTAQYYYAEIRTTIKSRVEKVFEQEGEIHHDQLVNIVDDTIAQAHAQLEEADRLPNLREGIELQLAETYGETIDRSIENVFEKLPMSDVRRSQLKEIASLAFTKWFPPDVSGVVVAGFGTVQRFPAITAIQVDGVVNDTLKYVTVHEQQIDSDTIAMILPFAQQEMVSTFMEGVDPRYEEVLNGYLTQLFDEYPRVLVNSLVSSTVDEKQKLLDALLQQSKGMLADLKDLLAKYRRQMYVDPIIGVVSVLPKDELAAMAESLVNLTSFKRRVSMEAETVGGPIDVAVISKGDGFVWIKRKHYFDAQLNHHFFANYFSTSQGGSL